jgi:hypothetical protein
MEMVGNRHSKGALVELVCWLIQRTDDAEERLRFVGQHGLLALDSATGKPGGNGQKLVAASGMNIADAMLAARGVEGGKP